MTRASLTSVVPENSIRFTGHPTHAHAEPHLVYVAVGEADVVADGRRHHLLTHEALWLAPHVPHSVRMPAGSLVLGPLLDASATPPVRVRSIGVAPRIVEIMTATLGAAPTTPEQVAPFRSALGEALSAHHATFFDVVMPRHQVARAIAVEARSTPWTLEELSRRHHLSGRQVQRLFLAETGLSFSQWRTRSRLNVAIGALLAGRSTPDAARHAGYASGTSLRRALAREADLDPDTLRRDGAGALPDRVA